jgi:nucleoside-diphosphate-sugar epimerase
MRVLVTGATGFIGRAVVRNLLEGGHEAIALVRTPGKKKNLPEGTRVSYGDVMIPESLRRPLSLSDAVVHCAAIVDYGLYPGELVQRVNLGGTLGLLELARDAGIRRFLYVGSMAAYGTGNVRDGIRDETSLETRPDRFASPYELSKYRTAMAIIKNYPETILVMPGMVYGPGSQVDILLRLVTSGKFPFFIRGENRVPLVHIEDVAEATGLALEKAPPGQYLCVSDVLSLRELGLVLARVSGKRPPIFLGQGILKFLAGPGPAFIRAMGISPILNPCSVRMALGDWGLFSDRLRELGWRPRALEEGLSYLSGKGR